MKKQINLIRTLEVKISVSIKYTNYSMESALYSIYALVVLVLENAWANTVRAHFSEIINIFSHHRLNYSTYLINGYVTDDIYESKDKNKNVWRVGTFKF